MLPETAVPFCARLIVMGANTPPVPALPDHVPATSAVGALAAAFSASRAAAHPVATAHTNASIVIANLFIADLLSHAARRADAINATLVV